MILADVITPFMFITGTRLIIANVVIAFIESFILGLFFKVRRRRLFGWMVLANYFSVVAGGILLGIVGDALIPFFQPMIFHLRSYHVCMFALAMVLSFGLELPFVIVARWPRPGSLLGSLGACAAAQVGSYAVLAPLYWLVCVGCFNFDSLVSPTYSLDFVKQKSAVILFLSSDHQSVMEARLDGVPAQTLMGTGYPSLGNLAVWKADDADRWDLWLTQFWNSHDGRNNPSEKLLQRGITPTYHDVVAENQGDGDASFDWRPKANRDWTVEVHSEAYAPRAGFRAHNQATGNDVRIVVDTPFVGWLARCATILPGDQVVFEISGQIVVLDLDTRRLGFIAFGHSPVVIAPGMVDLRSMTQTTQARE